MTVRDEGKLYEKFKLPVTYDLSYTRSSATAEKQRVSCPRGGGLGPPAHSPFAPLATPMHMVESETREKTYVKRAVHEAHFKMNRAFKVIQESRTV